VYLSVWTDLTVWEMHPYGFTCKLDMMANFSVPQELLWGYYLQHVKETRFVPGTHKTYQDLLVIARRLKNYFVITTNADGLFERNNFDLARLHHEAADKARPSATNYPKHCPTPGKSSQPAVARWPACIATAIWLSSCRSGSRQTLTVAIRKWQPAMTSLPTGTSMANV
jgi:hypothetical protein